MNWLKNLLESQSKHFEKGHKLHRLYPVFEMIDTLIYSPKDTTSGTTHIRDGIDLKRIMTIVIIALLPCLLMAFYNTGYQANLAIETNGLNPDGNWRIDFMHWANLSFDPNNFASNVMMGSLYFLPLYIATMVVGGFWEVLFCVVRKHEVGEAFLVTSMLYPLILPPLVPIWQAMAALSIGLILGKEIFGGVGRNIVNPALISRAVLFFSYPAGVTGDTVWVAVDGFSSATPLGGTALFGQLGVDVSFLDAFLGFIPGSMGETSALACLFGAFVLIVTGIGSWRIMLSTITGLVVTVLLFNMVGSDTNPMFNLAPHWHLVLGGFAFGTVFMATDPVTACVTHKGQVIYGCLIGVMAALVRVLNPAYPEGMMLAILFANVFSPVIDHFVVNANIKRRELRNVS
jgi:Na+-transporting NADH:ubiquinone oxidoreductase subunit B